MNNEIDKLYETIHKVLGKDISVYDQAFLIRALDKMKAELEIIDTAEFCCALSDDPSIANSFHQSLSVQYTEFFREPLTYSLLEKIVCPTIISKMKDGQEIRIWSAGCSTGQEPYSAAMILSDLSEIGKKDIRYRIFATDYSESALEKARLGAYHYDSVKNIKLYQIEKYFLKMNGSYQVVPRLQQQIVFSYYDLLDKATSHPPEAIFGEFDLILCCNLLFYYNQEQRKIILKKLMQALAPQGFLITGEVEKCCAENLFKNKAIHISGPIFKKQLSLGIHD